MKRKYLEKLVEWKNKPDRKPLMVWGARQVGKTFLIEELFAKEYYPNSYLKIDCSNDEDFVNYVTEHNQLDKVLLYIELNYNFKPDKNHLLFIDEVQECLPIVKMMKHFNEIRRDIPLIVSGSLVRLKIFRSAHKRGVRTDKKKFLFPVGKINELYIYPLTFDEFLINYKPNIYEYLKDCYTNNKSIDAGFHSKFLEIFKEYLFIGGMPEAVDFFIKNVEKDRAFAFKNVVLIIKEIYNNYLADMDLYQVSPEAIIRSRLIYKDIYKQLNKENKNFKFSLTEKNARGRDMLNPIGWLVEAKIVNQSFELKEKITTPLTENNDSLMRLYLADMGMFTYQSGLNARMFTLNSENSLSGIYYENYMACELVARDIKLFYWRGKRDSEFEFILDLDGRVIPIDVKKGKSRLNSLDEFRNHNKKRLAIKISSNQYGYNNEKEILTIPFYFVPFFLDDLENGLVRIYK